MSRNRDSQQSQRTVAELLAQHGGSVESGSRRRHRRRADDDGDDGAPAEADIATTAPQAIIERIRSETGDTGGEDRNGHPHPTPRHESANGSSAPPPPAGGTAPPEGGRHGTIDSRPNHVEPAEPRHAGQPQHPPRPAQAPRSADASHPPATSQFPAGPAAPSPPPPRQAHPGSGYSQSVQQHRRQLDGGTAGADAEPRRGQHPAQGEDLAQAWGEDAYPDPWQAATTVRTGPSREADTDEFAPVSGEDPGRQPGVGPQDGLAPAVSGGDIADQDAGELPAHEDDVHQAGIAVEEPDVDVDAPAYAPDDDGTGVASDGWFADADLRGADRYADDSEYADAYPDEYDDEFEERSPVKQWLVMAGQLVLGVLGGAVVWLSFNWLWMRTPAAALIAALAVIVGLVWLVRKIRRAEDMQTTVLAVLVGLMVTVSPAAMLLLSR
ncbi:hypothetical protein H0B56_03455 [Haloechinothrix sp. YIM 98757]|uniref:Uncharacterized protein n=1 Tax=Haloechinothrix aidingensis TaxID=2752311 RepID=A0A838A8E0_9PSEU|nr:hypothetical protein [Haloechinothrix aidingensis]MBA0124592.1 hypothetical protein [Haloechinothrix aidingensis]